MLRSCGSCPESTRRGRCRPGFARSAAAVLALPAGLAGANPGPMVGGEPIQVVVLDRPPYYVVHDGKPSGFLLLRAKRFIEAAKIPVGAYATYPPRRILAMIRRNEGRFCSVGWFRTAERENYARYSSPIHVDRPHIVLAHPDAWQAVSAKGALLPLMDDDSDKAVAQATKIVNDFDPLAEACRLDVMRRKLGMVEPRPGDHELVASLLSLMHKARADFTLTFRNSGPGWVDHADAGQPNKP